MAGLPYKRPISVLVVIHTTTLQVLLLERVVPAGFWQSVTGSLEADESPLQAAIREVNEETGLAVSSGQLHDWHHTNRFEILKDWRARYAPGVTHNTEHVFSLCVPTPRPVRLAPAEHCMQLWLPFEEAAGKASSWTNRDAILMLPRLTAQQPDAPG
ncbi:dihydroneopterin triphosphate diphosphatase [Aromatoleum bremense]|uniref:Dihydroneopterin triphosphate diphosphatase n=1 Tax=Aromatoleum bremense TaxID=76115 RepID=A0ABX1P0A3_9RHOO|nr:dihydroneopterin triphosphate diphosphatase [Aromatoleum bremense]NMG17743.1 dihydroneopterin triphosphate diphosphatase [Aromatoleum bremense]QTQ32825.1 Hydrolase, NUDIX family [Aromatoleum bremense]